MIQAIIAFLAMIAQLLQPAPPAPVYTHQVSGIASWYESGTTTACGTPYNPAGLSIALVDFSRDLCGVEARIEWKGQVVYAIINDHMPDNDRGRVVDLSRGTKEALGMGDLGQVTISY